MHGTGHNDTAIVDTSPIPEDLMPDLLVHGVDESVVRALTERAVAKGRSVEAEHREILSAALTRPKRRPLAEPLASMPDVGNDDDFERHA